MKYLFTNWNIRLIPNVNQYLLIWKEPISKFSWKTTSLWAIKKLQCIRNFSISLYPLFKSSKFPLYDLNTCLITIAAETPTITAPTIFDGIRYFFENLSHCDTSYFIYCWFVASATFWSFASTWRFSLNITIYIFYNISWIELWLYYPIWLNNNVIKPQY